MASGEGGLLGLALDPDGRHLYAYCTTASDNRVSRFRYEPSAPAGERLTRAETLVSGIPRGEVIHNDGWPDFEGRGGNETDGRGDPAAGDDRVLRLRVS